MKGKQRTGVSSRGQASIETIISAGTIAMFLPAIIAMFEYARIQEWLQETSRYIAWERSVWADRDQADWDLDPVDDASDRIITRSDQEVARQAMLRIGQSRRQLMVDGDAADATAALESMFEVPDLVNWSSAKRSSGDESMFASEVTPATLLASATMNSPERENMINYLGVDGGGVDLGIVDAEKGLKLSDANLAIVDVSLPVKNLFSDTPIDTNPIGGGDDAGLDPLGEELGTTITMTASAALQTNPWSPKNEDVFQRKVHNLDVLDLTRTAASMASLGLATGADAINGSLNETGQDAATKFGKFVPFLGQINAMYPSLAQDSADVPFNRVKLYDYDDVGFASSPCDVYSGALSTYVTPDC